MRRTFKVALALALMVVVVVILTGCQTADPSQATPHIVVTMNVGGEVQVWTDTRGASQSEQASELDAAAEVDLPGSGEIEFSE